MTGVFAKYVWSTRMCSELFAPKITHFPLIYGIAKIMILAEKLTASVRCSPVLCQINNFSNYGRQYKMTTPLPNVPHTVHTFSNSFFNLLGKNLDTYICRRHSFIWHSFLSFAKICFWMWNWHEVSIASDDGYVPDLNQWWSNLLIY